MTFPLKLILNDEYRLNGVQVIIKHQYNDNKCNIRFLNTCLDCFFELSGKDDPIGYPVSGRTPDESLLLGFIGISSPSIFCPSIKACCVICICAIICCCCCCRLDKEALLLALFALLRLPEEGGIAVKWVCCNKLIWSCS